MRAARLLNLRRVRRQPLRVAISVIAIAAGVSFAVGVLIMNRSTTKAIDEFARALAGPTELRVIGATTRGGLDQNVLPLVDAVDGVASAVPMVQSVTYIDTGRGPTATAVVLGVDCRVEQLLGSFGCSPAALSAVTADAPPFVGSGLARKLGTHAQILTDIGRSPLDRNVVVPDLDRLNAGNVVVYPLHVAQSLFARTGRLDAIYVIPDAGVDVAVLQTRLQEVVGGWNAVLRADQPPPGATAVASAFLPAFGMLSLMALAIGALLIFNTLSLSLEERRRDLAVIGALGARPRTVIGGVLAEAGVMGLVGGLLGTLGGALAAQPMTASVSDFTRKFMGVPVAVSLSPGIVVLGALLGALVGVVAAWVPARRATRIDVAAELSLRDRRVETARRGSVRRVVVFTALTILGVAFCWLAQANGSLEPWQPAFAPLGVLVVSIGGLLAAGSAAPLCARLLQRADRGDGPVRLGIANLVRDPGRTSVMTIAIGAAVGMGFLIASAQDSIHHAIASGEAAEPDQLTGYRVPTNNTLNVDAKIDDALVQKLAAVPGVASVTRQAGVGLRSGSNLMGVVGRDATALESLELIKGRNDTAHFERGNVMVGAALAREEKLQPGSRLRLATPTGYRYVTVGGIWHNGNFTGRAVNMPWHLFEELYGTEPSFQVGITPAAGVSLRALADRIDGLGIDPDLEVITPDESIDQAMDEIGTFLAPFEALQRSMLIIAFIAVVSTLLLVGVQRRRELGLLAAVGMEPRQLSRMTLVEAAAVGVIAVLLAGVVGALMNIGFTLIVPVLIGFKQEIRYDLVSLIVASVLAIAIVGLAAAFPAWRTSRVEVLGALQYE